MENPLILQAVMKKRANFYDFRQNISALIAELKIKWQKLFYFSQGWGIAHFTRHWRVDFLAW